MFADRMKIGEDTDSAERAQENLVLILWGLDSSGANMKVEDNRQDVQVIVVE